MTGIVLLLIGLIIVGVKLRRVHDAFYIKSEFFFLMLIAIVMLPVYLIAISLSPGSTAFAVGIWGFLLMCIVMGFVR